MILISNLQYFYDDECNQVLWYPILIVSLGFVSNLLGSLIGTYIMKINIDEDTGKTNIKFNLFLQSLLSYILMIALTWIMSIPLLPGNGWAVVTHNYPNSAKKKWWSICECITIGIVMSFLIEYSNFIFTSEN